MVAHWYLEYLLETGFMSSLMRLDNYKGAETVTMATMDAFLHKYNTDDDIDPTDTELYGPSTSNQVCTFTCFGK